MRCSAQIQTYLALKVQLQCSHCHIGWKQNKCRFHHHCFAGWARSECHEFCWWLKCALSCWTLFYPHWSGRQTQDEDKPLQHTQTCGSLLGLGKHSSVGWLSQVQLQHRDTDRMFHCYTIVCVAWEAQSIMHWAVIHSSTHTHPHSVVPASTWSCGTGYIHYSICSACYESHVWSVLPVSLCIHTRSQNRLYQLRTTTGTNYISRTTP